MDLLKSIRGTFIKITAGITLSVTIFITINSPDSAINVTVLWQIIAMSAISAFGNIIYFTKKELTKKNMKQRIILHYLYINLVNVSGAYYWNWIKRDNLYHFIALVFAIGAVYVMVMMLEFGKERKTADKLNQRLRKYHEEEEKEEYER